MPASSGKTTRRRLSRGGDGNANHALYQRSPFRRDRRDPRGEPVPNMSRLFGGTLVRGGGLDEPQERRFFPRQELAGSGCQVGRRVASPVQTAGPGK
ncbi:hypothetical protein [Arthrobacter sp. QXT-31]|uniref:hypothetical protein n=1 Tax=Arthrobacter sp. QXT-31 TaxID=1357915 RepID=UPI003FA497C3